jgi:alpha-tubulin suppressor-like RCC1 family protein
MRIPVKESEEAVSHKPNSMIMAGGDNELIHDTKEVKVVQCSAGFGHTAALSENGELFMWGFNVYGQLGSGDKKSRFTPVRIERDILGNHI